MSPSLGRVRRDRRERALAAANRLEELLPDLREVVNLLRVGTGPGARPHALVYEVRRELTRVVRLLDVGGLDRPTPSGYPWPSWVQEEDA